jgi:hypothetical protein
LGEIRGDLAVGALLGAFEVSLVAIANFHQVRLLGFFGRLEQYIAANPEADEPKVHAVIRACWFRQGRRRKSDQPPIQDKPEARRLGRTAEDELASRGFWHIHIPSDYLEVPSERSSASLLAKQIAAEQRNERREQLRLVDSIGPASGTAI